MCTLICLGQVGRRASASQAENSAAGSSDRSRLGPAVSQTVSPLASSASLTSRCWSALRVSQRCLTKCSVITSVTRSTHGFKPFPCSHAEGRGPYGIRTVLVCMGTQMPCPLASPCRREALNVRRRLGTQAEGSTPPPRASRCSEATRGTHRRAALLPASAPNGTTRRTSRQ
jgi:hypothetical protein